MTTSPSDESRRGTSVARVNGGSAGGGVVRAKTRKRCPFCHKMVEVGESATLTDDRYRSERIQDFGRQYARGAWHLWHPECFTQCREHFATREATR